MGKTFLRETSKLLQAKRRRKRWKKTLIPLSLAVVLATSSMLTYPALTMESSVTCGMGEHTHTQECYERQLSCGQEEREAVAETSEQILSCQMEVHDHTEECLDEEGQIICGKEAHVHGEGCYETVYTPGVEGHTHTEACYQDVLVCQKPEHTHSESCYPQQETAPAESEAAEAPAAEPEVAEAAAAEPQATEAPAAEPQATEAPVAEPETTEAPAAESETEDLVEMEPNTSTEPTVTWKAQTLTATGTDYTIQVEAPESAKIPEGTVLKVQELKKDTTPQDYADHKQEASEKVSQKLAKDVLYGRYFRLALEADGSQIQPSAKVTVKITYNNAVNHSQGTAVKAISFGDTTEILDVETNGDALTWSVAKAEISKMTVVAFVGVGVETEEETELVEMETTPETPEEETTPVEETEPEEEAPVEEAEPEEEVPVEEAKPEEEVPVEEAVANVLTAENDEYSVTVSYDESAGLPEGVSLSIASYSEESTEYQVAREAVIAAMQGEDEFSADMLLMKALDISILDNEGYELEPNSTVSVKIEMKNLPEECNPEELEVHHIVDSSAVATYAMEGRTVSDGGNLQAEEVARGMVVENGVAVAEFTTESFSTFTISWKSGWFTKSVSVECIDENENVLSNAPSNFELSGGDSLTLNKENINLAIEDYEFVSAKAVIDNTTYENVSSLSLSYSYSWWSSWSSTIISNGESKASSNIDSISLTLIYRKAQPTASFIVTGGSVAAPDSISGAEGTEITLPDYEGTKDDHEFIGWSTSENAEEPEYQPGASYTLTADNVKFYAVWDSKIILRFDVNGGSGSVDIITGESGANVTLPDYTGTKQNYLFAGWADNKNWQEGQSIYPAGTVYTLQSDKTFYAVWKTAVTLTLEPNGGNESIDSITGLPGATVTLPNYTGENGDYTFLGWTDTADLESDVSYHQVYLAGAEYTLPNANTTLYAVWNNKENGTTDFFVRLDGTIPSEPGSYASSRYTAGIKKENNIKEKHQWIIDTEGTKVAGPNADNKVSKNLNTLPTAAELAAVINKSSGSIGYSVKATEDGKLYKVDGTDENGEANLTDELYVLWYVQKYQGNGGTNDKTWHIDGVLLVKSKVTLTYVANTNDKVNEMPRGYQESEGTEVKIGADGSKNGTVKTPERAGYTFVNWNTRADGSGTSYNNNDMYTLNEDTTLYAQWSKGKNFLTISKTDTAGQVLQGAKFKLEEKLDSGDAWTSVAADLTTSANGIATFNNVNSQTVYRMTETYAPNGYETRNSFCFKVTTASDSDSTILALYVTDENGNILPNDQKPSWVTVDYTQSSTSGGAAQLKITIQDEQIKRNITFVKEDLNGNKLSGATFELSKDRKIVTGVLKDTSDQKGIFSVDNATLTYGIYTLTETKAPDGYQLTAPIKITLNDPTGDAATTDGTYTVNTGVTFGDDGADYASVSVTRKTSNEDNKVTTTYSYTITVKDRPKVDVNVIKTDKNDNTLKLAGVTFKLMEQKLSGNYSAMDITGVTGTDGSFTITDAQNGVTFSLDDGTYKLTEISAPAGYILNVADTVFTITNGQVQPLENAQNATLTSENGKFILAIENEAGVALPNTGGSGTLLYTLSGLLLLSIALMYGLVLRRRRV